MNKHKIKSELIRRYNSSGDTESILELLLDSENLTDKAQACALLINKDRTTEALDELNNIEVTKYPEKSRPAVQSLIDYVNVYASVASKEGLLSDSDLGELNRIEEQNNGQASVWARNLKSAVQFSDYTEPILFPKINRAQITEDPHFKEVNSSSVYPNPAANHVIVSAPEIINLVVITDINGKEV